MAEISQSISPDDFRPIAESIATELEARQGRRSTIEKQWKEIDRQLRMEPELSHKKNADGKIDPKRAWMPEVELPLQSGALETLLSDVRIMRYPPNRDWFNARAALTAQYLREWERAGSFFPGDRGADPRANMEQDNADKLVQGLVSTWHSRYDFRGHMDLVDAHAIAYGFGVGRLRMVNHRALGHDARAEAKMKRTPILVPRDSKKVYLDDSQHALMLEGQMVGPNTMEIFRKKKADLMAAAVDDTTYVIEELERAKPDKTGHLEIVEMEGDLVWDRGSETVIERDVIVTVTYGDKQPAMIRVQENHSLSTYHIHHYHVEGAQFRYGTSPLMKGMPIARAAAQAANRLLESAQLKNSPPVQYDPDEPTFAAEGGPVISPYANWESSTDIVVHDKVGGDPGTLLQMFLSFLGMYADVTGVTPARLGAQTKSHTTAFAKDVEVQRGASRTVDYERATREGPMTRLLGLEYRMGLEAMRGRETVYIQEWNEFVSLKKGHLPSIVKFNAFGAGAPAEEEARVAEKLGSAQTAIQLDSIAAQFEQGPVIDYPKMIEQVLTEGGWTNVVEFLREAGAQNIPEEGQLEGILSSEPSRAI